jgi:plasmid replication initiation protein
MDSQIAIQANNLVRSNQGLLTLTQKRILLYLISMIKPSDDDFKYYRIKVSDFASMLPNNSTNEIQECMRAIDSLEDKKIKIDFGDHITSTRLVLKAKYYVGQAYFEVLLDDEMKPLLLNLREQFTEVYIRHALSLTSTHAVRLYEILKSWQSTGRLITTPNALREMLGVPEKYQIYSHFKSKCIKPALDQIHKFTDLKIITLNEKKTGRKVTEITIIFSHRKALSMAKNSNKRDQDNDIHVELKSRGIYNPSSFNISNDIWKKALETETKDAPANHIITTAKKLSNQITSNNELKNKPDYLKINKLYWEENNSKYINLMPSDSYLQSNYGDVITWNDPIFIEKLNPYLKNKD